jgi:hypothetical protein
MFSLKVDRTGVISDIHRVVAHLVGDLSVDASGAISGLNVVQTLDDAVTKIISLPAIGERERASSAIDAARGLLKQQSVKFSHQRDTTRIQYECYCRWKDLRHLERVERQHIVDANPPPSPPLPQQSKYSDAIVVLEIDEGAQRRELINAYYAYVNWIDDKIQSSHAASQQRRDERLAAEAARAQVKAMLEAEMQGKAANDESNRLMALQAMRDDERRQREAAEQERLAHEQRRREEAIALRAREQEEQARQQQAAEERRKEAQKLRDEEEALRRRLQEREDARLREAAQQDVERKMLAEHLAAEEQILTMKLEQKRKAEEKKKHEEHLSLLEHIAAEEALLKAKMIARQERAAHDAELARRKLEDEKRESDRARASLLEHCAAEEQLLQQRVREKERQRMEAAQHEREEALRVLQNQERQLREHQQQRQVHQDLVREQEEIFKEIERQRQLQELQRQESKLLARLQSQHTSQASSPAPPPHHPQQQFADPMFQYQSQPSHQQQQQYQHAFIAPQPVPTAAPQQRSQYEQHYHQAPQFQLQQTALPPPPAYQSPYAPPYATAPPAWN